MHWREFGNVVCSLKLVQKDGRKEILQSRVLLRYYEGQPAGWPDPHMPSPQKPAACKLSARTGPNVLSRARGRLRRPMKVSAME